MEGVYGRMFTGGIQIAFYAFRNFSLLRSEEQHES